MSPRKPDVLPEPVVAALQAALAKCDADEQSVKEARKAAVQKALRHGSIRQVAAAIGRSPTTVHAWSQGRDR